MPYWKLYYHLVWTTSKREPVIDQATERIIERSMRTSCDTQEAVLHAVGMMPDHLHVAVSIPPSVAVSTFVGRLKGASTHAVNDAGRTSGQATFAWQAEYGVLSFGERNLPDVADYIRNQRTRHADNRLWPSLEQAMPPKEPASAGLWGSARGL